MSEVPFRSLLSHEAGETFLCENRTEQLNNNHPSPYTTTHQEGKSGTTTNRLPRRTAFQHQQLQ
eukprot:scaffold3257_cov152-Amphora_coffeaeformis.AAC.7